LAGWCVWRGDGGGAVDYRRVHRTAVPADGDRENSQHWRSVGRRHRQRFDPARRASRVRSCGSVDLSSRTMMNRNGEPLVTVATFDTVFETCVAKGALEAIGISALVPEENMTGRRAHFNPVAQLQVFESDATRAVAELRRMQMRVVE